MTVKSKVLRDGEVVLIDSEKLTIGDYVLLESGDKISADLRKKVKANNDLIEMLPNREVREQRKLRSEVENYNNEKTNVSIIQIKLEKSI